MIQNKKALVANAADASQVKNAENRILNGRDRELRDIYEILQLRAGRRFVWRLLSMGGVFKTSFTGNSTTFFNEGMRSLALHVLSDVSESHPEGYLLMMKEAKEEGNQTQS